MSTVTTLITGACRLLGRVGEGETPSTALLSDSLSVLNDLIDSLNTERLVIPQIQEENFALASGSQSKTIGSGGNFNTTRPISIEYAYVRDVNSVDYPLTIINPLQYAGIPLKTLQSTYPEFLFYETAYPLGTLWFYPVPNQALTLYLKTRKQLTSYATVSDVLSLAPGYARMLRFNLAIELAPEFGIEPLPKVEKIAAKAMRDIKRLNAPNDVLSMPVSMFGRNTYDINIDR